MINPRADPWEMRIQKYVQSVNTLSNAVDYLDAKITSCNVPGNTIVFRPASEYREEEHGSVVHFKGFGQRIPFRDNQECQAWGEKAVELVTKMEPDTIAWDGDDFEETSFTAMIPHMYSKRAARLIMFLRDNDRDRERVLRTWSAASFHEAVRMDCFLVDGNIDFRKLGQMAMEHTKSKHVVSLGGGMVVEEEFATTPLDVTYHLCPVARRTTDFNGWEQCRLASKVAPNLKVYQK